jgi:hypothetical protein
MYNLKKLSYIIFLTCRHAFSYLPRGVANIGTGVISQVQDSALRMRCKIGNDVTLGILTAVYTALDSLAAEGHPALWPLLTKLFNSVMKHGYMFRINLDAVTQFQLLRME